MQLKPNTTLHPNCPQTEAESLTLLGTTATSTEVTEYEEETTDETDYSKVEDKPTPPTYFTKEDYQKMGSPTNVIIPDGVTHIADWAFARCEALTSITLPNSITEIGEGAFVGCNNLNMIYTNRNFIYEEGILYNKGKTRVISALKAVVKGAITLPNSITEIGEWAFAFCSSLTSIRVSQSSPIYNQLKKEYGNKVKPY